MVRITRRNAWTAVVALTALLPVSALASSDDTPSTTPTTGGCEVADEPTTSIPPDATAPPTTHSAAEPAGSASTAPTTEAAVDALDAWHAVDVALRTTPGFAFEIDADDERGRDVWEVRVRQEDGSGIEHYVAADTGEILRSSPAGAPRIAESPTAVSLCEAIMVATEAIAGSHVIEGDLDTERGRTVWEVLVRTDTQRIELYIDAETGEVLKQEVDD